MILTGDIRKSQDNIIDKINQKYGTQFADMDKVLLKIGND
jgi:hypothetical protein